MNKSTHFVTFLIVFAIGLPLLSGVSATTYVNDLPNGSTTWTAQNSPYSLTTDLIIDNSKTLNIQPGVVVYLNGYQIQVYGLLNAQGSNNNKIYFVNEGFTNSQIIFKASSDQSCTVDYGVFYSIPIIIEGGAPKLTNSYFTGTSSTAVITVNSGAALIADNVISTHNTQNGIHISTGFVTITRNILSGAHAQQGYGIYNTGSTAPITGNTIINFYTGIYTNQPGTIQQNIITNNVNDGIVVESNFVVTISNNSIAYNRCGISRDANIQNNTISHNTYGLWGQTDRSTILYNNIVDNTIESIHLTEAANVNATNNWWGTTIESTISQTISDYDPTLRPNLGKVTFSPFLTSPANSPSVPNSVVVPTPPPLPPTTSDPQVSNSTSTPTPDIYPTHTADSSQPTDKPPEYGGFSITDVITAVVIVTTVSVAITIIVVLNWAQTNRQKDNTTTNT